MPGESPVPALSGGLLDFLTGLGLPFRSVALVCKGGRLFVLTALASLVTSATLVGLVIGLWPLASRFARSVIGDGGWLSAVGAGFLYLVLLVLGAFTVPSVMLAPLQDPIS